MVKKNRRYVLFAAPNEHRRGGINDFCGWYESFEEACEELKLIRQSWFQVVDINTMEIVCEGYKSPTTNRISFTINDRKR